MINIDRINIFSGVTHGTRSAGRKLIFLVCIQELVILYRADSRLMKDTLTADVLLRKLR